MATFTVSFKRLIELTGGVVTLGPDNVSRLEGGKTGFEGYPIFDEDYRPVLTGKIVDHYWNREIGVETIDMFQLAARRLMNEIMPYYNDLYKSKLIDFDPMKTVDLRTLSSSSREATANSTTVNDASSNAVSKSRAVTSDLPQTQLRRNADYATGGADSSAENDTTSLGQNDSDSTEEENSAGDTTVSGYQAMPAELLMRYRESILNIDLMVIRDLNELFMGVWDTGDEYATRGYLL